jgi:hypothetical protein
VCVLLWVDVSTELSGVVEVGRESQVVGESKNEQAMMAWGEIGLVWVVQ